MSNSIFRIVCGVSVLNLATFSHADPLEEQSNPVPDGTIQVAAGDPDRSDWEGIPWYEEDEDFDDFFPVDIFRIQVANDSQNVYFHLESIAWEVDEAWRIGTYLDADADETTGYNGNFLAVGSDYLIEGSTTYQFTGGTQAEWGWGHTADLERDQSSMLDVELAIPRSAIGNPTEFNFILFANNFCCDFQEPDDIYPNEGANLDGFYLSYELGTVILPGDFDGNGNLDLQDINALHEQIALATNDVSFDLNADKVVDTTDSEIWVRDLKRSWFGDANLDGKFNSSDLVSVFQAGKFEQDIAASWQHGDWNADQRFGSGDLVKAFQDAGYEQGPRAAGKLIPEPESALILLIGLIAIHCRQRRPSRSLLFFELSGPQNNPLDHGRSSINLWR